MAGDARPGDVSDKAIIELGPIVAGLREQIDVDGETWTAVVRALTKALMAGVRIGGAEVAAQAIERGMPVTLNMHVESVEPQSE
jgi:histidinol-phosphate/aromatic aminotransferase/cobyric acid decarboxylase-like protein